MTILILAPLGLQIANIGETVLGQMLARVILTIMMYAWYWWWVEISWIARMFAHSSSKVFRSLHPSQDEADQEDYNQNGDLHEKLINVSFDRGQEEEELLRKFNETQNPRQKLEAFVLQFTTARSQLLVKFLSVFFALYLLVSLGSFNFP